MSETPKPKSLAAKLAEVMAAVERIPKRGRNTFHNYEYATEADIVAAIRKELAERKVILLPAVLDETRVPVGEKGSHLTTLSLEFEFLDGESGESIRKPWKGYGTDKDDKGGYKAMTGGEKYFLLKTFLIPTGDDPEADKGQERDRGESRRPQARTRGSSDSTPVGARPSVPAPEPSPAHPAAAPAEGVPTVASILERARGLGWKDAEVSSHVRKRFNKGLSSLSTDELTQLAQDIETGEAA
jgi:hypothetical protein